MFRSLHITNDHTSESRCPLFIKLVKIISHTVCELICFNYFSFSLFVSDCNLFLDNWRNVLATVSAGMPWTRLPHVTPAQVTAARRIRKFFTGDLDHQVGTSHSFARSFLHYARKKRLFVGLPVSTKACLYPYCMYTVYIYIMYLFDNSFYLIIITYYLFIWFICNLVLRYLNKI